MNIDQFERHNGLLTPQWMMKLSAMDRARVMDWIKKHGANPEQCAWVRVLPDGRVLAKMYAVDTQGRAEFRDGEVQYAEDIIFTPTYLPDVVIQRLSTHDSKWVGKLPPNVKDKINERYPGTA